MAISRRTLDFLSRWIYTPLAFAITVFFAYITLTGKYLGNEGRPILAIAGSLGLLTLFWMYYVRWFVADSQFIYPVWPPYLSACPDYLTYMGKDPRTQKAMCVDFTGVGRRNGIKRSDILLPPKPEERDYIFLTSASDTAEKKCNDALGRGLSWSGITAGTGCA
jgi:hypothetical protein